MTKPKAPTFKIKPKTGVTVKDPETLVPLKNAGEEKPRNIYWLRRVKDGDCLVIAPKPTAKKVAAKETK